MKNDDIKKAYDHLTPDDETKERMLRNIMMMSSEIEQNASAKPVIVPWYVRLRMPMGISAAAMACAMVFTLALNNPALVQDSSSHQNMLGTKPAASVSAVTVTTTDCTTSKTTETTAVETKISKTPAVQTASITSTAAQTPTITAPVNNFLNTSSSSEIHTAAPKPVTSNVVTPPPTTSTEALITTVSVETVTTPAETAVTTEHSAVTTEISESSVTTTTTKKPILYGNIHDYNHVELAGAEYITYYECIPYEELDDTLGSGVAVGELIGGSYTILMYSINDTPVEEAIAVQYAGQQTYYLFYNID